MKGNSVYALFYLILGMVVTVSIFAFGGGMFGLLFGIICLSIAIWYWVKPPYQPKCKKCRMVCREGVKNCPSCNAEM